MASPNLQHRRVIGKFLSGAIGVVLLSAGLQGCSDDSKGDDAAAAGTAGSGPVINVGGKGTVGTGGGATVSSGGGSSCMIEDDGSGCAGEAHEPENIPLDIYIMFDQSGSMCSCVDPEFPAGVAQPCPNSECAATRLDAVREATSLFLADPESAGIGIGIGYFGKQPIGQASCDVAEYTSAAVEIGPLPDHGSAIMDSLNAIGPTGETPTGPAIRGACDYAQSWKDENPGRQVVILLLTDGKPEAPATCPNGSGPCCPTLTDAVQAATECLDDGVKTYVLGVGPLLENLQEIAVAGGTHQAYLVEGGNVSAEVLDALNRIRGAAIPCEFNLPPPPPDQTLALDQVNITYANAACEPTFYSYVETVDLCGPEGGWYYDVPDAPTKAQLCPSSCDQVGAPGGRLLFTVGCQTRIQIQ